MNNLYLLESSDSSLISLSIDKILKENNFTRDDLHLYDLDETNIIDVINDLDTYGFFENRKIVYAKSTTFLTVNKCDINHNVDAFTKYINNPKDDCVLIISCPKLDGKKNICKLIKDKFVCLNLDIDKKDFVKSKTKGYKISLVDINYLLNSCGDDLTRISNELDKLMLLCDNKEITRKDIDLVVIKKIDDNIFDLIDAIINKDKKKSLTIYNEMINYGEEVFHIFVSLANQIRLLYQVKVLNYSSDSEIMSLLNIKNPKQVSALRYRVNKYSESDLKDYLYKLSLMDEELKLGKAIDNVVFPIFIASL